MSTSSSTDDPIVVAALSMVRGFYDYHRVLLAENKTFCQQCNPVELPDGIRYVVVWMQNKPTYGQDRIWKDGRDYVLTVIKKNGRQVGRKKGYGNGVYSLNGVWVMVKELKEQITAGTERKTNIAPKELVEEEKSSLPMDFEEPSD